MNYAQKLIDTARDRATKKRRAKIRAMMPESFWEAERTRFERLLLFGKEEG